LETAEYYKLAEVEDSMWYFRALHEHAAGLIEAHGPGAEGVLLDAGCGTGGLLRRFQRRFPGLCVTGIDLFQVACELAISLGTPRVSRAAATALPFADGSVAVVTSLDVLQHVVDHEQAAAEFFRVLKPGGLAVINVPAYMWLWSYHDHATGTERRYTRPEMARMLSRAGFEIISSTYWNFIPLPAVVAKRKLFARFGAGDDVKLYPAWAERMLDAGMALERKWISRVSPIGAGSSVLVAARKPGGEPGARS
jgi:SAM-dependent methyltransferase